ncbi:MAG: hypothetical protein WD055_02925 [Candidatus Dependentiae bacterium]
MKKKILLIACFLTVSMSAKLRIRQQNPQWANRHYACCADRRGAIVPYGVTNAEDAVNALREEIVKAEDNGTYIADWGKKRRAALEIQSQLGFTVPEDYSFNDDDE